MISLLAKWLSRLIVGDFFRFFLISAVFGLVVVVADRLYSIFSQLSVYLDNALNGIGDSSNIPPLLGCVLDALGLDVFFTSVVSLMLQIWFIQITAFALILSTKMALKLNRILMSALT